MDGCCTVKANWFDNLTVKQWGIMIDNDLLLFSATKKEHHSSSSYITGVPSRVRTKKRFNPRMVSTRGFLADYGQNGGKRVLSSLPQL